LQVGPAFQGAHTFQQYLMFIRQCLHELGLHF